MSPLVLRILLALGALATLGSIISRVKKSQIQVEDATFWVLLAAVLVVVAIFPQVLFFFADLFGVESPINLLFVLVCAVLVIKEFQSAAEISMLKHKVTQLSQELALARHEDA